MNMNFAHAMRAAAQLTRAGRLLDATRAIQNELSATDGEGQNHSSPEKRRSSPSIESLRLVDLTQEPPALPERTTTARTHTETQHALPQGARPKQVIRGRVTRRLGEVIGALRTAKRRLLNDEALRPIVARRSPIIPEGAQFLTRSFTCAVGSRTYKLYVPQRKSVGRPALLLMLHGCTQDPDDFAIGTRMNMVAEEHGLIVIYPWQPKSANPSSCWNWFNPKDQTRGAGEPAILVGITQEIITEYDIDPARVFVAGLSAGGAMAAVMGNAYPDVYAAIGVHSGLPYRSATDVVSAFTAMRGDPSGADLRINPPDLGEPTPVRTIVFHGESDQTVHPSNAEKFVKSRLSGGGHIAEAEVHNSGARPFTRTIIRGDCGSVLVEQWLIRGAGHAWSGGSAEGSYTDPQGPDASREMLRFFLEHS